MQAQAACWPACSNGSSGVTSPGHHANEEEEEEEDEYDYDYESLSDGKDTYHGVCNAWNRRQILHFKISMNSWAKMPHKLYVIS